MYRFLAAAGLVLAFGSAAVAAPSPKPTGMMMHKSMSKSSMSKSSMSKSSMKGPKASPAAMMKPAAGSANAGGQSTAMPGAGAPKGAPPSHSP